MRHVFPIALALLFPALCRADSIDVLVTNQAFLDGQRERWRVRSYQLDSGEWADRPRTQDPLGWSVLFKAGVRTANLLIGEAAISGTQGRVEIERLGGPFVGAFAWDFPLIGSNWSALSVGPDYVVTEDLRKSERLGAITNRVTLAYTIRRRKDTTPPVAVPTGGPGILRGVVRWSSSRVRLRGAPTVALLPQALDIGVSAPAVFKKYVAGAARYGGVAGTFEGRQRVGRVFFTPLRQAALPSGRCAARQPPRRRRLDDLPTTAHPLERADEECAFEIRDLPIDVPLALEAREGAAGLWEPAPGNEPRDAFKTLHGLTFHIDCRVSQDFQGVLAGATPQVDGLRIGLEGVWLSDEGGVAEGSVAREDIGDRVRRFINPWDHSARPAEKFRITPGARRRAR